MIFVTIGLANTRESNSKRVQKREAKDMAGEQEDNNTSNSGAKDRVCLVEPMSTTVVPTRTSDQGAGQEVVHCHQKGPWK